MERDQLDRSLKMLSNINLFVTIDLSSIIKFLLKFGDVVGH